MTRKVTFALETDLVDRVWNAMNALGVRHVPVTRNRKVVGILSDRDILKLAKEDPDGRLKVPSRLVGEVMTKDVFTCHTRSSIGEVAKIFIDKKIDSLPVVHEGGELVGIITTTDLLRLLCEMEGELFRELPFKWDPELLVTDQWRPAANN